VSAAVLGIAASTTFVVAITPAAVQAAVEPSITFVKQTFGGTGQFALSAASTTGGPTYTTNTLDTGVSNPAQQAINIVEPGTYRFREALPGAPSFAVRSLTCVVTHGDGTSTTFDQQSDATGPYVEFTVLNPNPATVPADSAVCTAVNDRLATVSVKKLTTPPNLPVTFTFDVRTGSPIGTVVQTVSDSAADNTATQFLNEIAPGTYAVTEQINGGFVPGTGTCVRPAVAGDTPVSANALVVGAGEAWECTFTNVQKGTIEIEKQTNSAVPTAQQFTFNVPASLGAGTFSLADDGVQTFTNVMPGDYTFSESASTGWSLLTLTCTDGTVVPPTNGFVTPPAVTVNVSPGETVRCTFTNTQDATIQVTKVTQAPAGAPTPAPFAFTGAITANLTGGQSSTPLQVTPNPAVPYTVVESVPSNWALTTISCIDLVTGLPTPNAAGTVGTATASFNPDPGQHLSCTYTNSQGAIQLTKTTIPAGSAQQFSFTVTGPAGTLTQDNGAPTTARTVNVASGSPFTVYGKPGVTYTVTETVPTGWKQSGNSCAAGATPGANATTTCSFTNTALGGVTVTKSVTGAHAGEAWSFAFTISPAPPAPQTAGITVNGTGSGTATATWTNLDPDTIYTITETAVPGTSPFLSGQISCGGSPVAGVIGIQVQPTPGSTVAPVQCTATNIRTGSISVAKVLVDGTVINPTDTFNFTVAGGPSAVSIPLNGIGSGVTSAPVAPLTPSAYFAADGSLSGTPVPYAVKESDPADPRYRLMSVQCVAGTTVKYVNNGGPFLDPSAVVASINLLPGEDVVCTFTNDFVDVAINKVDSLDPVTPGAGSTVTYTLGVTNNGTGTPLADAMVQDSLADFPAQVVFTGTPPADCVYVTTRLATCAIPAASLDPGETATVALTVSVPADTAVPAGGLTFDNSAWVTTTEEACPGGAECTPPVCPANPGWGDNATCEPTTIGPSADLEIAKLAQGPDSAGPNNANTPGTAELVIPGDRVTFALQVTNHGPSTAQQLVVTDPLNAQLSAPMFVSATGGFTCDALVGGVAVPGGPLATPLTCASDALAVGATASVVFSALVVDPVTATAPFQNTTTVTAATPEHVPPVFANSDVAYLHTFDLSIDKVFRDGIDTTPAVAGGPAFTYMLTVRNLGTGAAIGAATVVDDLPTGMVWSGTQPAGCSAAGQVLTCTIPAAELGVGGVATRVVNVDVPAGTAPGTYTNDVRVTHPDDSNTANNADSESTPVVAQVGLSIVKDAGVQSVVVGGTVNYTITVRNVGPSTATSVRVVDELPPGLTALSVTSSFFTCTLVPTVCTAPSLAPGQTQTINVVASVASTGLTNGQSLRNIASVSSSASGPQPAPSTDDATISVVLPALPPTGSDTARLVAIAAALVLVGVGAILLSLRRHRRAV